MPRKGKIREQDTQEGYRAEGMNSFLPNDYSSPPKSLGSPVEQRISNKKREDSHYEYQEIKDVHEDGDSKMEQIFCEQVSADTTLDGSGVVISVIDGVLHLSGIVSSDESRERLMQLAGSLEGVKKVEDTIRVRPYVSIRYCNSNGQSSGTSGVRASISIERERK